ncbi:MAG: TIGR00730 family Rossman fold protein [Phycisphaerales bacterium JB043]
MQSGTLRDMSGSKPIKSVTLYCAASPNVDEAYLEVAHAFGAGLARTGRALIYGGGAIGLMGAASRGCRDNGGRAVGIITTRLRDAEQLDLNNSENIVVRTMRERKAMLEAWGDALVVLPGGIGTLEEFFEVFVGRLLGEHDKPLVLVDPPDPYHPEERGYYDPLLRMLEHMIDSRFMKRQALELLHICHSAESAITTLESIESNGSVDVATLEDAHPYLPVSTTDGD